VARKMTGPHSHRGGHWFDPSIAHQVSGYVDLRRDRPGSHSCSQAVSEPVRSRPWRAGAGGAKTASTSITRGSAPVRLALKELATTRATRTVAMAHAGLTRAVRHAEANDKVRRNVATLVDTPAGQEGRPSKSLTFGQAVALIRAAQSYGLYAYVVLSLLVGVRTEEARALRWDHVDLEGNPDAEPPVPPHVDVWRSVRAHGDTKTKKSRRSLGLPRMAVEVLREHLQRQADARLRAGVL
jgi:integrase